jgi:hypothetical protein
MSFIQKNKSVFPEWWKTMLFFTATYVHVGPSHTSLTGLSPSLNISYQWLLWLFNTFSCLSILHGLMDPDDECTTILQNIWNHSPLMQHHIPTLLWKCHISQHVIIILYVWPLNKFHLWWSSVGTDFCTLDMGCISIQEVNLEQTLRIGEHMPRLKSEAKILQINKY